MNALWQRLWWAVCLVGGLALAGPAVGESLAVVAAADSALDKLSPDSVRLIFNRKRLVDPEGQRWIPVNLPATDPLRRGFSLALFDALPEDLEEYWNNLYFHGLYPPDVLASEEAVLRFVTATPGAIGYVRAPLADRRVKILLLISLPAPPSKPR